MKRIWNRKKGSFLIPVATGFLALYFVTMGLVTWIMKEKFTDEYIHSFEQTAATLLRKAAEQEREVSDEAKEYSGNERQVTAQREDFYRDLVNEYFGNAANPQLNIAVAVYDKERKLLAKSCETIGDSRFSADTSLESYGLYMLDDYLTFEQKKELADFYWKGKQSTAGSTLPEKYRISIRTSSEGEKLYDIFVQKITWEEGQEAQEKQYVDSLTKEIVSIQVGMEVDLATGMETGEERCFYETDSKVVWKWANPEVSDEQRDGGEFRVPDLSFPYMSSFRSWHRWSGNEFFHNFPKVGGFSREKAYEYPSFYTLKGGWCLRGVYKAKVGDWDEPFAYMEFRMEEYPWADAVEYMAYLYLAGLLLTVVCIFVVSRSFGRTYARQRALEETRRDITNVMAHELKTPLGVIRNFAENLIEHNMEEKRDYYLSQIIGQTEEMDFLVVEMIETSKLDSDELVLKKETVSFGELIREEMEKFAPMIDEKNLRVQYQEEEDFLVEGDREYLGKAVWNLISNAVDYNVPDGRILVRTEDGRCIIENTGKTLDEEQILHAFDLFYTGNKNRGKKEKHLGLGLFLVKKILGLHGMGVMLENTEDGVRVVVKEN